MLPVAWRARLAGVVEAFVSNACFLALVRSGRAIDLVEPFDCAQGNSSPQGRLSIAQVYSLRYAKRCAPHRATATGEPPLSPRSHPRSAIPMSRRLSHSTPLRAGSQSLGAPDHHAYTKAFAWFGECSAPQC